MELKFDVTLLIQFINLIVVLFLLNIFLFKPVLRALARRNEAIASSSGRAALLVDESRILERTYDEDSKERRKPIQAGRDALLADAHAASMKAIEQARTELGAELTKIRSQVGDESRAVFEKVRKDVDKLSTEAAEKILERKI